MAISLAYRRDSEGPRKAPIVFEYDWRSVLCELYVYVDCRAKISLFSSGEGKE